MRHLLLIIWAMSVASCGVAYRSPSVSAGPNVQIVTMTADAIRTANLTPYQPRVLPPAFSASASSGGDMRGPGALPEPAASPLPDRTVMNRPPQGADPGPYIIGIGDVLELRTPTAGNSLSATAEGDMQAHRYSIQNDGAVAIPRLGRVLLGGRSMEEAETILFQSLVQNEIDPTFSLDIVAFNARKVTIGGAVATPTVVPLTLTPLYLNEALARAGGADIGDQDGAVLRLYRGGRLYDLPFAAYLSDPDLQRLRLTDGDSIYVDRTHDPDQAASYFEQQIILAQTRQQARDAALRELATQVALRRDALAEQRANFAARSDLGAVPRDHVYLFGEVGVQARYPLPFGQQASLADALFDAGSGVPLETGDISQIYVLRTGDGQTIAWHLDARNAANLTLATQFELRPNDIVFIGEQPVTRWGRVVEQLTPSLITAAAGR